VNKYVTGPLTDGGKSHIPLLDYKGQDGTTLLTTTNMEKSLALTRAFFPPPPTLLFLTHNMQTQLTSLGTS